MNLRELWNRWRAFAQALGDFQGRIILTLFYFIIVAPGGLIVRAFSDPLHLKHVPGRSMWVTHRSEPPTLDDARRQY